MNISRYIYPMAVGAVLLSSCADDLQKSIVVDKPESVIEDERYKDLNALKSYVQGGNLKISASVSADDILEGGLTAAVSVNNFNELAAEASFAHGAVVKDDGTPDFTKIQSLANTAEKYGMTVFGGPLVWSDNQSAKYLSGLIAPKVVEVVVPDTPVEVPDFVTNGSFNENNVNNWANNWQGPTFSRTSEGSGYCIEYTIGEAGANQWDKQGIYTLPVAMEQGKTYVVKIKAKASNPPSDDPETDAAKVFGLWPIWSTSENKNEWGGSNDVQYLASYAVFSEWTEYTWKFEASFPHDKLQFVFGKLGGSMYFDDLSVVEAGSDNEMVANGTFDAESIDGWSNNWQGPTYARIEDKNYFIEYQCGEAGTNQWDKQAIYTLGTPMLQGSKYTVKLKVRAENEGTVGLWPIWSTSENKNQWGGSNDVQYLDTYEVGTSWKELTWEFNASFPHDQLQFVFGTQSGNIYFDDLSVDGPAAAPTPQPGGSTWENVLANPDCEGTDVSAFVSKEYPGTESIAAKIVDGEGVDGGRCVVVNSAKKVSESWDSQFWIVTPEFYPEGTTFKLEFDYKASAAVTVGTQAHEAPGNYNHWSFAGDINFTTEWQHYEKTFTLDANQTAKQGFKSCAFNLSVDSDVTYYFDNMQVLFEHKDEPTKELTDEEKSDTLKWALNEWLKGIMDATNGTITNWDVIADPLSNSVDIEGSDLYALQKSSAPNGDKAASGQAFYWQDYIDNVELVRMAIDTTRKYFAGDKSQLKLFVSEYGLEKDSKKVSSLLHWIDAWEDDDTKIDGISVQLHLTTSDNVDGVKSALTALAQSGKLIRIGSLDVAGADDEKVAEMYKEVAKAYLSSVPAAQQYGINLSGIQSGLDYTSLWTEEYKRNASYKAFVEGLGGK